ncbi:MAG: AraC family transcriptional regulator [Bacteroidota bacterium]|nr:AraC family transcriptional regulator [Bacteroidota bacterium]
MTLAQTINDKSFIYKKKSPTAREVNLNINDRQNQQLALNGLNTPAIYGVVRNLNDRENQTSTIFIKNMICLRCKIAVRSLLEEMGLECIRLELGEVKIRGTLTKGQFEQLNNTLLKTGLELVVDKKIILAEKIKNLITQSLLQSDDLPETKNSVFLSEKLHLDYHYLSNVFSEIQGINIEQYIIKQRIAWVRELLTHDELTLSQIAWKLHYSSVAHLSHQFKKMTGLTASRFRETTHRKLREKDEVTI